MSPLATFIIAITTLLLTALGLIAKEDVNFEVRKFLTWMVFVIVTLVSPSLFITWLTMQIVARILAPTVIDLSSFTLQVSWWTSGVSMIYPFIWGMWLFPKIRIYIRERILMLPNTQEVSKSDDLSTSKGETAK